MSVMDEVFSSHQWLIGGLAISLLLWLCVGTVRVLRDPLRDIPGPWMARISRLWLARAYASRAFHDCNLDLHRRHGSIVRIGPNEYSIDDPDAAQVIYRSQDPLQKAPRYLAWGVPTDEQNIFSTTDDSRHAFRRRQTAKLYTWTTLTGFEPNLDQLTEKLLNQLRTFANSGEVLELNQWCHYYALDAIGMISLGRPFGLIEAGGDVAGLMASIQFFVRYGTIVGVYAEMHAAIHKILSSFAPKGEFGLGYLVKIMNDAIAGMRTSYYSDKKKSDALSHNRDVVSILYQMHAADPKGFSEDDIRFHVVPLIGGGSDTTGATLSAVMYYLIKYPSVLYRLRQELAETERDGKLSHPAAQKDVMECRYLQAVIKETMRIFPGVGLTMPRIVPKGGMMIAGRFFPAGATVGINAWVAHFNRTVFGADAHVFRPERWLDASVEELATMERYFMTFGRGPRTCLGKFIPQMEIGKVVPELISQFDFEMADGPMAEWEYVNDWFVRQNNFKVRVAPRAKRAA